jgi:hypothetical protein
MHTSARSLQPSPHPLSDHHQHHYTSHPPRPPTSHPSHPPCPKKTTPHEIYATDDLFLNSLEPTSRLHGQSVTPEPLSPRPALTSPKSLSTSPISTRDSASLTALLRAVLVVSTVNDAICTRAATAATNIYAPTPKRPSDDLFLTYDALVKCEVCATPCDSSSNSSQGANLPNHCVTPCAAAQSRLHLPNLLAPHLPSKVHDYRPA